MLKKYLINPNLNLHFTALINIFQYLYNKNKSTCHV